MTGRLLIGLILLPVLAFANSQSGYPLQHAKIDLHDSASLQRGAQLFMNNCLGCHSLKFMTYQQMGKGIGITNEEGKLYTDLVQKNLIFTDAKITAPILSAMTAKEGQDWLGIAPPDLSLVARARGSDWIYTYLKSFYSDIHRPTGSNNVLFPDVAMPNVLEYLQGQQIPLYREQTITVDGKPMQLKEIAHLALVQDGKMTPDHFDLAVTDLVNFLTYVSEPMQLERRALGGWVLGFLVIFAILAYLLKREYWRDISKKRN